MSNNIYDDYDTHCITGPIDLTPRTVPEERAGLLAERRWALFDARVRELPAQEQADYWRCYADAKAGTATTQQRERQAAYHGKIGWEGWAP